MLLKRIIVGMDTSDYSKAALRFACEQLAETKGVAIGLGIINQPSAEPLAMATASLGAVIPLPATLETPEDAETQQRLESVESEFTGMCDFYGVKHQFLRPGGAPVASLMREGARADLAVLGTRTFFTSPNEPDSLDPLRWFTSSGVCPLVVMPKREETPKRFLMAYDGSVEATRAMRLFNYQLASRKLRSEITVLTVNDSREDGERIASTAQDYLLGFGHDVRVEITDGDATDVVREYAASFPPSLTVLGASTKTVVKKLLFGSVTETLLDDGTLPVYLSA